MEGKTLSIYLISTALLAVVGVLAVGLSFAAMFLEGRGSSFGIMLLVVSIISPAIGAYFIVKYFSVIWWYPAIAVISPALVWIIFGYFKPHTNPTILFAPVLLLLALTLPAGWAANTKRQNAPNTYEAPRSQQAIKD